jgi:hypothetical protein
MYQSPECGHCQESICGGGDGKYECFHCNKKFTEDEFGDAKRERTVVVCAQCSREQVMRLVLSRLVVADQSWQTAVAAPCTGTHRCSGLASLYPTAWMGKLRTHPWLPGDGSSGCEPLNKKNLGCRRSLLHAVHELEFIPTTLEVKLVSRPLVPNHGPHHWMTLMLVTGCISIHWAWFVSRT